MAQETFSAQTLTRDIKDFNSLDSQKKLMIAGVVLVLFVGSVFVGSYLSNGSQQTPPVTNQEDQTTGTEQPSGQQDKKPTTSLMMTAEKTMKVGSSQVVTVELSKVPVTAADLVITYDPEVFTVSDIQNGVVFPKVIQKKIDDTKGVLTFSGSVDPANPNNLSEGKVISFKLTANSEASSSLLQFSKDDTITAINGENTLGLTTGATISVTK